MIVGQRVLGGSSHGLYVVVPLPNGHSWIINGGDPNHLLTGMILQVGPFVLFFLRFWSQIPSFLQTPMSADR